ncbi:hypothetical protein A8926_1209 [Saccharopolyspora spinosa]|uniref:Uncharacterized protein n=1 Tax=Saccharopolyspora spinosa TaxID=60894 RepID=A0A2N3XSR5_SACSN|nr:hypothetical protein A8926_1209 [Saccharopolyspora spinosa]
MSLPFDPFEADALEAAGPVQTCLAGGITLGTRGKRLSGQIRARNHGERSRRASKAAGDTDFRANARGTASARVPPHMETRSGS